MMSFFELIGRFFFERNRVVILFIIFSAPFFIVLSLLAPRYFTLLDVEHTFDAAALRGRCALEKRMQKERFLHRFASSEPYFIDQSLESLSFLQKEKSELQLIRNHPACSNRQAVDQRIAFLESAENSLAFAEENIRTSKRIKETDERQLHPIELDVDDLEHLLSLIEDMPIGAYAPNSHSPQLLIQDFLLTKKDRTVYQLNLSLLKREFFYSHEKKQ
jgi:hypothetical protein